MTRSDAKLGLRYLLITASTYMCWHTIQPEFILALKDYGDLAVGTIYGSVYGMNAVILAAHFREGIDKQN